MTTAAADTTDQKLKTANDIIAKLLNALSNIQRAETIAYAQGAAEFAIQTASQRMTRNRHGYLEV